MEKMALSNTPGVLIPKSSRTPEEVKEKVNTALDSDSHIQSLLTLLGMQITVDSLNKKIHIDDWEVQIAELDSKNPISLDFEFSEDDRYDYLTISGITSSGKCFEIDLYLQYVFRDGSSTVSSLWINKDDVAYITIFNTQGWLYLPADCIEGEDFSEEDFFECNGKKFISWGVSSPEEINIKIL